MIPKLQYLRKNLLAVFLVCCITGVSAQDKFSFSCLIDGQSFSENGMSAIENTAFKTAPDLINIALVSMNPKYKGTVPPQIAFSISPNASTTIKANNGKYTAKYTMAGELDNDYVAQLVTVNIISITANRIAGTFSGKFANRFKTITITNGKFDLPASKYSKPLK